MGDEHSDDSELLFAYIDTNLLLEFPPPDKIEWKKHLNVERVRLVVTPVVLSELQQAKDSRSSLPKGKRRKAGERIALLEKLLCPDDSIAGLLESAKLGVEPGVEIGFESEAISEAFLDEHRLSRTLPDDQLVGYALRAQKLGRKVRLLTNDAGPRLVGRSRGLVATRLPLQQNGDEQPEGHSDARVPNLQVSFWNQAKNEYEPFAEVTAVPTWSTEQAEQFLRQVGDLLDERWEDAPKLIRGYERVISASEHADQKREFMGSARKAVEQLRLERALARLEVCVRNTGSRSFSGSVALRLPSNVGARWVDRDERHDEQYSWPMQLPSPFRLHHRVESRFQSRISRWTCNSHFAECGLKHLYHDPSGVWTTLEGPSVVLDHAKAIGFAVEYAFRGPDLEKAVEGELNVKVVRSSEELEPLSLDFYRNQPLR